MTPKSDPGSVAAGTPNTTLLGSPAPDQNTDAVPAKPEAKPTPSPETLSLINPSTPPQNEVYNSQKPQRPEVDSNTGRLVYRYPIAVPPGRKGLQPDVKLVYTSGSGEKQGVFGEDWSVTIPYIERVNKHGVDQLYSATFSPAFVSSEDGELATTTVTSVYAARVNTGDFRSYVLSSSSWVVTDKKGTRYTYGSSTSTRLDDPSDSLRMYRWMLEEVRDTNGNYISYAYTKESGQIYPSAITYTGHDSTPGIFEIDFVLESRTDTATSWSFGFDVHTKKRIKEIDVKVNGALSRKYALAYTTGSNGETSLLQSITESGRSESGVTTTLPVTRFSYDSNSPAWVSDTSWYLPTYINTNSREMGYKFADVNGDGLPDLVYSHYFSGIGTTYESYINDGQGWTSATSWNLPVILMSDWNEKGYKILDVNGDHLPDIVYSKYGGIRESYINNGSGWTSDSSWYLPVDFMDQYDHDNGYRILDVNGDGLPDIILANFVSGVGIVYETYINNGHGWGTDDPAWHLPLAITSDRQDSGYELSDVNGDGTGGPPPTDGERGHDSRHQLRRRVRRDHGWGVGQSSQHRVRSHVSKPDGERLQPGVCGRVEVSALPFGRGGNCGSWDESGDGVVHGKRLGYLDCARPWHDAEGGDGVAGRERRRYRLGIAHGSAFRKHKY